MRAGRRRMCEWCSIGPGRERKISWVRFWVGRADGNVMIAREVCYVGGMLSCGFVFVGFLVYDTRLPGTCTSIIQKSRGAR